MNCAQNVVLGEFVHSEASNLGTVCLYCSSVRRFRRQRLAYARGELSLEEMSHSVQYWITHPAHGDT